MNEYEKMDWHNNKRSDSFVKIKEIYNDDKSKDLYLNVTKEAILSRNKNDSFVSIPNSEKDNIGIGFWINNTLCRTATPRLLSIILPNNIVIFVKKYTYELCNREPTEDNKNTIEYVLKIYDHEDNLRLLNNEFIDYIVTNFKYKDFEKPPKILKD